MAGIKLLVADDSLTIQKVIRLALSGATTASGNTYDIQAVSDGNDAIQQIALFRPDVVLIDVSLPGKTAFEVKRAINELSDLSAVRFVLMSSAFEKVDEVQADEVVFHGRLTKPFDPAHLREVISESLAQVERHRTEPTVMLKMPSPPSPAPTPAPTFAPGPESSPVPEPISIAPQIAPEPLPSKPEGFPAFDFDEPSTGDLPPPPPKPTTFPDEDSLSLPDFAPPPFESPTQLGSPKFEAEKFDLPKFEPEAPLAQPAKIDLAVDPHPPLHMTQEPDTQSDIKHLTESTIRLSGLDDFQWTVQEPVLKPPASLTDSDRLTFPKESKTPPPVPNTQSELDLDGYLAKNSAQQQAQSQQPLQASPIPSSPSPVMPPPMDGFGIGPASGPNPHSAPNLDMIRDAVRGSIKTQTLVNEPAPARDLSIVETSAEESTSIPTVREIEEIVTAQVHAKIEEQVHQQLDARLEEIIRTEVESVLHRMAQDILPQVAEKLIKAEIHRMLSEQP